MSEAQRLNMVGGHFIWLWADTSSTTEFYDTYYPTHPAPSSATRKTLESLRAAADVLGSPSQSANLFNQGSGPRDKSRAPPVTSSSSTSGGRQRENERRTDQRGRRPGQQYLGNSKADKDNRDNPKRDRVHLPVAGRSRPGSEPNDKSRNSRDLANPTVASSAPASLPNEQLATPPADDDDEWYENDGLKVDSEELDQYSERAERVGDSHYEDSERRIWELLRKVPQPKNTGAKDKPQEEQKITSGHRASIRLAEDVTPAVDDKWAAGNRTASAAVAETPSVAATSTPLKPLSADIDPIIKHGVDSTAEEEAAKLKRMLSLANMNNSDVLFHHFKDFPIGLLALRPVRMTVERSFIKATVQLFANTWKRVEAAALGQAKESSWSWQFDGERWRRKRRRRKRSDAEEEMLVDASDKLDVKGDGWKESRVSSQIELFSGANKDKRGDELPNSVVNNTLNQQNQSFNASDLGQHVHNTSYSLSNHNINSESKDMLPSAPSSSKSVQNSINSGNTDSLRSATVTDATTSDRVTRISALTVDAGDSTVDLLGISASAKDNSDFLRTKKGNVNSGVAESPDLNRIKNGPGSSSASQRQQILGAWAKSGRLGSNNNNIGKRLGSPKFSGGCYGTPNKNDVKRAQSFAR